MAFETKLTDTRSGRVGRCVTNHSGRREQTTGLTFHKIVKSKKWLKFWNLVTIFGITMRIHSNKYKHAQYWFTN